MNQKLWALLFLSALLPWNSSAQRSKAAQDTLLKSSVLSGLKFRSIGPAWASGRIADFAMNPNKPSEYYVGVASGNLWKTSNNGTTWQPIFDNYGSYSIGVVELDPNNPHVVWVGTGENNHQRAIGYGDGVYKSLDGGQSFKNMGLKDSRHIGGIVIDPRNSNVVFVAAEGSLWGPGGDRGLYKTTDGGENWIRVLEVSEHTGINNVVMDPSNPDILYATSEQRRRHHYGKISGGPESAVYKSTDGGQNWRKIMKGLPKGIDIGGMGIDVSPVDPNVLYLIMEAEDDKGGFFRSTNKGETWQKMSDYNSSGQYYNEIHCDPKDVDKVFSTETRTRYTVDGGKTWTQLGRKDRHVDDHAIWIDPSNTEHLLIGGDGGIYESYDMGEHWDFKENLPITQFYRVAVDNAEPFYNVYGGTQDNNSMGGPSQNTSEKGVSSDEWEAILGGDGFWQAIDPEDPNTVYTEYQYGNMYRVNRETGEQTNIKPREGKAEKAYKWNWDAPLLLSPHSNTRLYAAANKVFRSDDRGQSWEVISDDLTAQKDRDELKFMDRYWSADAVRKHVSTSQWGTIVSLDESRVQEGLLYAGTDDGVISITEDGGKNWRQVKALGRNNPFNVPEYSYISDLQADKFDANVVYVTFKNLKRDDFKPYVFKSSDKGKTWKSISSNLPDNQPVHSIQQDHKVADLLFVGTEFGIFYSNNGGQSWLQLKAGLPTIQVRDIAIQEREDDLVLATFGRGFYILDNYAPLREISEDWLQATDGAVLPVKTAKLFVPKNDRGNQGSTFYVAKNPAYGATFTYYLKETPKTAKQLRKKKEKQLAKEKAFIPQPSWRELQLEGQEEKAHLVFTIRDAAKKVVRRLTAPAKAGVQRLTWDLRYPAPYAIQTKAFDPTKDGRSGWPVVPGTYTVEMQLWDNDTLTNLGEAVAFQVEKLFQADMSKTEAQTLASFNQKVMEMVRVSNATDKALSQMENRLTVIRQTIYATTIPQELSQKARALAKRIEALRFTFDGVPARASWEEIPPAQMPISKRVGEVAYARYSSMGPVTQTEQRGYEIIKEELSALLEEMRAVSEKEIPALEAELEQYKAPWTPGRVPLWDE